MALTSFCGSLRPEGSLGKASQSPVTALVPSGLHCLLCEIKCSLATYVQSCEGESRGKGTCRLGGWPSPCGLVSAAGLRLWIPSFC